MERPSYLMLPITCHSGTAPASCLLRDTQECPGGFFWQGGEMPRASGDHRLRAMGQSFLLHYISKNPPPSI